MKFIKLRTGTYFSTQKTRRTMCVWCNSTARSRYHFRRGKALRITCWLRIIGILSRQPACPRVSCFWRQNSGTQRNQNATELPERNFSPSRVSRTKQKKKRKTVQVEKRRRSGPALILLSVAKSLTQFTNVSIGITILYCVFWTVYCVLCTVNGLVCAVNCVLCAVNSVLCTVYCVLCTVHYEQCTVRYELFTVNCVLCSLNCVLFTVKCVLFILYSV